MNAGTVCITIVAGSAGRALGTRLRSRMDSLREALKGFSEWMTGMFAEAFQSELNFMVSQSAITPLVAMDDSAGCDDGHRRERPA
jgi:hypothetical protein